MENQRVHEYSVMTGSNGLPVAQLGKVHNLITFVVSGQEKIHYLDGKWVDDGKNPIDPDTVPDHFKRQVAEIPFNPVRDGTPDVLVNCEFCEFSGAGREYAKHLIDKHIRKDTPDAAPVAAPLGLRPEDLPAGNYVVNEEGFVVLNKDGTPRRKAGRPSAEADASGE